MAGGAMERLLRALAGRLPEGTKWEDAAAALRVAAAALPDAKAKLRDKVSNTADTCTMKLLNMMKEAQSPEEEKPAEVEAEAPAGSDDEAEGDCESKGAAAAPKTQAASAYDDVDSEDILACATQCTTLLQDALARSHSRTSDVAAEAIEGFLSLHPPEPADSEAAGWSIDALQSMSRLVPLAAATVGTAEGRGPLVWRRLLTFFLLAPARLEESIPGADEAAARIGTLLALLARPAALRSALRLACATLRQEEGKRCLRRLVPVILPVLEVAFNPNGIDAEAVTRSDLLALLHCVRFLGVCKAARVSAPFLLGEAREVLRAALEAKFDGKPLLAGLDALCTDALGTRKKALRRRLDAATAGDSTGGANRTVAASLLVEVVELSAESLQPAQIARLVDLAGLPQGDDEATADWQAVAAKARGDLFFEDADGTAHDEAAVSLRDGVVTAAAAAAGKRVLEVLEGLEDLQPSAADASLDMPGEEDSVAEGAEGSDDEGVSRSGKKRKKAAVQGDAPQSPKKRKKKAA